MSVYKIHRWIKLHCGWLRRVPGMTRFVLWSYRPGWMVGNRPQRIWANINDALLSVVVLELMLKGFHEAAKRDLFDR